MKRFLTILLVLVLSFFLFVSCDPNTAKKDLTQNDDNKTSGGGTSQVEPSIEVPETEAKGNDFSKVNFESFILDYDKLIDSVLPNSLMKMPSKIDIEVETVFPKGIKLATEDDYINAAKDPNSGINKDGKPYNYKNIFIKTTLTKDSTNGKDRLSSEYLTIKYSNIENPTNDEYIVAEKGNTDQFFGDLMLLAYYHGTATNEYGTYLDALRLQDYVAFNLKPEAIINCSIKLYYTNGESAEITITTEDLEVSLVNNKATFKGKIFAIVNGVEFNFDVNFDVSHEGNMVRFSINENSYVETYEKIYFKINNLSLSCDLIDANLTGEATLNNTNNGCSFDIIVRYSDTLKDKENLSLFAQLDVKSEDINKVNDGNVLALLDCLKIYEFKYSGEEYSAESVKTVIKTMIENLQNNASKP